MAEPIVPDKEKRRGDWFLSAKGRRLYPLDIRPEDVDIEEIAHSLSKLCRFGGHCRTFYSVAQHSVLISEQLPAEHRLAGLLHDATEAYCGDMVRPLKRSMPAYRSVELNIWWAIRVCFNLPQELPEEVKRADNRMLQTERRDLLTEPYAETWDLDRAEIMPYQIKITPWSPERARKAFLHRFAVVRPEPDGEEG